MPESPYAIRIGQAPCIGIEEDDGLEASELCVVHLDFTKWLHKLAHDPHPDVVHHGILRGQK